MSKIQQQEGRAFLSEAMQGLRKKIQREFDLAKGESDSVVGGHKNSRSPNKSLLEVELY